jgi:hypothetical protein
MRRKHSIFIIDRDQLDGTASMSDMVSSPRDDTVVSTENKRPQTDVHHWRFIIEW